MSSSNRTTSKGGKGVKSDKSHKTDKPESVPTKGKGSTADKLQRDNAGSKSEDSVIKDKVRTLIDMTLRSEQEVCLALHECDNDVNQALNILLEKVNNGEWETTTVKKKKNRQASASKKEKAEEAPPGAVDDWNDSGAPQGGGNGSGDKDKGMRGKSGGGGGPPRLHGRHNDGRGWRGRERQENDRNLEGDGGRSGDFHRDRRGGRPGGPPRGGGLRGRGGGRAGGRYPPRNRNNSYNKPIDTWDSSNNTWDNSTALNTNHNTAEDNWDDFPGTDEWSTEEYTGSLADTKVFTPSQAPKSESEEPVSFSSALTQADAVVGTGQPLMNHQPPVQLPSQSPIAMVGTLNAAQTQYLNQLQQQNNDGVKGYGGAGPAYAAGAVPPSQSYTAATTQQYSNAPAYGNSSYPGGYGGTPEQPPAQQPATRTKTQRARLPPPSKIPASAVEMPGDINSSIGYLDVQFGAMDFMSDSSSFDGVSDTKYGAGTGGDSTGPSAVTGQGNLDLSSSSQNPAAGLDTYSSKAGSQQQGGGGGIGSALSQTLPNSDGIQQTSEHLYSGAQSRSASTQSTGAAQSLDKQSQQQQQDAHSYSQSSSSSYNAYQPKATTYNASSYSGGTQTTSSSYQGANSYVNSQPSSYNSSGGPNAYQNSYSSATSYQNSGASAGYPSITQANSYPASNQTYQQNASQSVYGATTGLNNGSNFGNTNTSQYNSYSSASSHKLVKESGYDGGSSSASAAQTTTSSSVAPSSAQTTISGSKATTALAKNSNSVVSNIPPPGAVMSTPYIVGQVPYFQQPIYSYEDVQLLQQRMPHMTTPYYDMSYQTPTTLAAVRDGTLSSVGYSLSDARFTRGDNNASPVPSTLSQQTSTLTQGHQAQPILTGAGPQYFFAPTAFNTLPNYQFGMYTQLPAATNAHGTSNSTQYPKPTTYGSGYGAYDALSQTQDYTKGAYVGNTQAQKGTAGNTSASGSTANDLSAMYGKTHTALGKVNSYEKQGFHSGTPPPFPGALHGSQNAGLAASGTGYPQQVYIPTMAPHQQHHSTPLMHQALHQMDVRHQGRHADSGNSSGQRSQTSNQAKAGSKQPYPTYSSWNQA